MLKLLKVLAYPLKLILMVLVYVYKFCISPLFPHTCRFYPTCSTYFLMSLKEWGVIKGSLLGIKRIFRCRPKGKCGEDFPPLNIKGDLKWVY